MDETPAQQEGEPVERATEQVQAPPSSSRSGWVWATVVVLALCGICGYFSTRESSRGTDGTPAAKRASTCAEWSAQTTAEKSAQAREMLTALRRVDGLDAPGSEMSQQFAGGITNVCSANSGWSLSEIASGLYLTERPTFG